MRNQKAAKVTPNWQAIARPRVSRVLASRDGVLMLSGKARPEEMALSPGQVIAKASRRLCERAAPYAGVYFLIWQEQVVYVGMASCLWARLNDHSREGRPFEKVAAIAGILPDTARIVEHAYAQAWSPPWNDAATSGACPASTKLHGLLMGLDNDGVMPWFTPKGGRELSLMKKWQLHVLGYRQRQ